MTEPEPPYPHVALCIAPTDGAVINAMATATTWLRADPRATFTAVYVAPALPALMGGLTEWGAVDPDDPLRPIRQWLDEATDSLVADTVVLQDRNPAAELSRWATKSGVDLVVAAASSSLVQRIALGSFTAGLAGHSDVPLLVVPPGSGDAAGEWTPQQPQRIVCCIDGSTAAEAAVDECRRLTLDDPESELTLLHAVVPPRPVRPHMFRRVLPAPRRRVRRSRAWLKNAFPETSHARRALIVGAGRDAAAWTQRHPTDLTVAGTRGEPGTPRMIGGFARDLCRHAETPVLLVPPRPSQQTAR